MRLLLAAWAAVRAEDKHCDWTSYATRYADVRAAFGYDEHALRAHYVAHGRGEGRACAINEAPAPAPPRPAGRVGAYVGVRDCALARVHGNSSLLEQRILELLQVASLETIIVEATSNAATTVARRYFPVTTVVARTEESVAARAAAASRAEDLDVVLYVDAASVSGDSDRFEALLAAFFEAGSHDAALIDDDAEPTAVVVSIDALSAAGLRGRKPRVVESTRGIDACANPAAARGASRISSNARVAPVLHRYPRVEGEISLNGVVHTFNISDAGGAIAGQIERICARLGCGEAGIGALMNYAWTRTPRA